MKYKNLFAVALTIFLFASAASAQKAEVTISLNEAFFDALLDSMFQNFDPPQFSISKAETKTTRGDAETGSFGTTHSGMASSFAARPNAPCAETIKILRENSTVRTAVRFREGKIYVPIAFSGD